MKQRNLSLSFWFLIFVSGCGCFIQLNESIKVSTIGERRDATFEEGALIEPQHISCITFGFPKRTVNEIDIINDRWHTGLQYVRKGELSFLESEALEMHRDLIHDVESQQVSGMLFECGVAKGGSSLLLSIVKHPNRCLHLFDTFQGMPKPSAADGPDVHERYKVIQDGKAGKNYYGYMKNLQQVVKMHIDKAGNNSTVYLHKGLFADTVWPVGPVAYAHLDGDWYESTIGMLERVHPFISIGGYMVLDDVEHFSGSRKALEDFFNFDVDLWLDQVKTFRANGDRSKCRAQHEGISYSLELRSRVVAKKMGEGGAEHEMKLCASKETNAGA